MGKVAKALTRVWGWGFGSSKGAAKSDYAIMVEPLSEADAGGWLATVPALPGCMGDGETPGAALADAEAAIVEWQMRRGSSACPNKKPQC